MDKAQKLLLTAVIGLCFFSATAIAQGKVSVRIPVDITVDAEQVTLGSVASVSGSDEAVVTRLQNISLGFSPRVGMTREIQRSNILLAVAAAGFNESDLTLDIPAKFLIKRAAQTVSQALLREAVERAVLPQFESENVTAKITRLTLPESLDLPVGNVEVRVINFSGITNFLAPAMISLELRVDGKILRRVAANIEIEAFADVLVLSHNGKSGARMTEADVQTKNIRLVQALKNYLRSPADLAGKKLLKDLPEASPLTADAVTADMVIKAGDTVSIIAQSGSMQIAVNGEARAAGRIGDRIAVKNLQSGVILQARVVDAGTVKLNF